MDGIQEALMELSMFLLKLQYSIQSAIDYFIDIYGLQRVCIFNLWINEINVSLKKQQQINTTK